MKSEYIYYLIDPIDHKVRYVGCTTNPMRRYKQHITKLDALPTPKRNWLLSLRARGLQPLIKVVEKCESNGRDREQYHLDLNKDTALNIHNPDKGAKSIEGRYPKTGARNKNDE